MICEKCGQRPPCGPCEAHVSVGDALRFAELERVLGRLIEPVDYIHAEEWGFLLDDAWHVAHRTYSCPLGLFLRTIVADGPLLPPLEHAARGMPLAIAGSREHALMCAVLDVHPRSLRGWIDGWRLSNRWPSLLTRVGRRLLELDASDRWADATAEPAAARLAIEPSVCGWDRALAVGVYWGRRFRAALPVGVTVLQVSSSRDPLAQIRELTTGGDL